MADSSDDGFSFSRAPRVVVDGAGRMDRKTQEPRHGPDERLHELVCCRRTSGVQACTLYEGFESV